MSRNLLDVLVAESAEALLHLASVCGTDTGFRILLRRLGWALETLPAPMQALSTHLREAEPVLRAVQADSGDPAAIVDAASLVAELARDIDGLASASFGGDLDAADFGREIAIALLHWIAIEQLDRRHAALLGVLRALGIVVRTEHEAVGTRPAYVEERVVLPDIGETLTSPSTLLRAAWAWGDPAFDATGLLDEVVAAFRGMGVSAGFMAVPPSARDVEEVGAGAVQWHAVARLLAGTHEGASYEAGLRILPFRDGADPALAVLPYVIGTLAAAIQFGDDLEVTIAGSGGVDDGRALVVSPTRVHLVEDLFGSDTPDFAGEIFPRHCGERRPTDK